MGFFSIELTDYNGKKFYNVTTDKWLREYPEDYKNYIKKTWEVKEHRMYKLSLHRSSLPCVCGYTKPARRDR